MQTDNNRYREFTIMLQEHERLIYKVCNIYAADDEDRKDLFQEIVLQAWTAYPRFSGNAKLSTWLYKVSLNTAITHKRKKRISTDNNIDSLLHLQDSSHIPDAEEYKLMHQMIANLPPLEKALVLLYLEDRSYQEIAEILGLSASNVGTKLGRIKERMKKQAQILINS